MTAAERQEADLRGASVCDGIGPLASWAGQPQWRMLQTDFGRGLEFLRVWRAWKDDADRPAMLHYVALAEAPCAKESILDAAGADPGLRGLVEALVAQWFGLLPGFHRLAFEGDRVLLTLCVGEARTGLRALGFSADRVLLCGTRPADLHRLKSIARLCRRGTLLAWQAGAMPASADLRQCGFVAAPGGDSVHGTDGTPRPRAIFDPPWELKGPREAIPAVPDRCIVVGGGLAGAAVAGSLARRGWQVEVLDAAATPASGASSLPAGLLVTHQSPDDSLLSRLSRAGVRMTLAQAAGLLREGEDWAPTGVLSHRPDAEAALPAEPAPELAPWSRAASVHLKAQAQLRAASPALWHERAGWVKPAALVRAWLGQPGIRWRGNARVARIERQGSDWCLADDSGAEMARASRVVVAAAHQGAGLLPRWMCLQPVRGQVSWASHPAGRGLPPFAVNGNGHLLPRVPLRGEQSWLCGATFDRDDTDLAVRPQDHAANLERLRQLLPAAAVALDPVFAAGAVRAWTGVRCASADRRPLVGELAPGLWVSTAMGSRGLTFAYLCAELIAARLHAEPLPLPIKLAAALDVQRQRAA